MKNLSPETRLKIYQAQNNQAGIKAMLEIIASREYQKSMKEFVK